MPFVENAVRHHEANVYDKTSSNLTIGTLRNYYAPHNSIIIPNIFGWTCYETDKNAFV